MQTLEQRLRKYRDHLILRERNQHKLLDIEDVINRLSTILNEPKLYNRSIKDNNKLN